jgi:peptidyl-prolyl cis-trans isomerase B (cyclophilin B)
VTRVTFETSHGHFIADLDDDAVPRTVTNFLNYVREGAYRGNLFHRVIEGFVVQGGGFDARMREQPAHGPIVNEAANARSNTRGTLAMARTRDPHSASRQFFVNVADNDFLDHQSATDAGYGYCAFGEVVEGMETVDTIATLPTTVVEGHTDVPREPVTIERVIIHDDPATP